MFRERLGGFSSVKYLSVFRGILGLFLQGLNVRGIVRIVRGNVWICSIFSVFNFFVVESWNAGAIVWRGMAVHNTVKYQYRLELNTC